MAKNLYHVFTRFLVENRIDFGRLVTHHFPIEKAQEALCLARDGRSQRIIFDL